MSASLRAQGLADFKPKDEPPIGPPDDEYVERETARSWDRIPSEFRRLSVADQAEMIAHEFIRATREMAYYEKSKSKTEDGGRRTEGAVNPMFSAMRARAGIG